MTELRHALAAYAAWLDYDHGERADAWLARLEINRPELEFLRAQLRPDVPAYSVVAWPVRHPDGNLALSDTPDSRLPADAQAALARARANMHLRAFTYLADGPAGGWHRLSCRGAGRGQGSDRRGGHAAKCRYRVAGPGAGAP